MRGGAPWHPGDVTDPNAPAGWYPDTTSPGRQRYWDGVAWTEHYHPDAVAAPAPAPVRRSRRPFVIAAAIAGVVILAVGGGVAAVAFQQNARGAELVDAFCERVASDPALFDEVESVADNWRAFGDALNEQRATTEEALALAARLDAVADRAEAVIGEIPFRGASTDSAEWVTAIDDARALARELETFQTGTDWDVIGAMNLMNGYLGGVNRDAAAFDCAGATDAAEEVPSGPIFDPATCPGDFYGTSPGAFPGDYAVLEEDWFRASGFAEPPAGGCGYYSVVFREDGLTDSAIVFYPGAGATMAEACGAWAESLGLHANYEDAGFSDSVVSHWLDDVYPAPGGVGVNCWTTDELAPGAIGPDFAPFVGQPFAALSVQRWR